MNYTELENHINSLKAKDEESYANWPRRKEAAKAIAAEVNKLFPLPDYLDLEVVKLYQEGLYSLGQVFSSDQLADIHKYLDGKMVYNSHVPPGDGVKRPLAESSASFHANCFDPEDILGCPHLLEFALSDRIINLTSHYLGCTPTLYSMNMWWTFRGNSQGVQAWHRDLDGMKFLALFIYLVDVDDNTGPHVFIKFTHDQEIMEKEAGQDCSIFFPPNPWPYPSFDHLVGQHIMTLTGNAGSAYLLDTFAIHKGSPNINKPRLVLWLRYGQHQEAPSLAQVPNPYNVDVKDRLEWNETNKYITRVLLNWQ